MNAEMIKTCHALHREALSVANELASTEFQMIQCLQKLDRNRVYQFFGFKSLFQYGVLALGLSDDRVYTLILVSRTASKIEKLQTALKEQKITLSKAKRISSVITNENADDWLKKAKSFSQRDLEQLVAKVNPKAGVQEGSHFISETMLEFNAAISLDTERAIKRAQDLVSQSLGKPATSDETLHAMAQIFLDKKDPVIKAARSIRRKIKKEAQTKSKGKPDLQVLRRVPQESPKRRSKSSLKRSPLKMQIKHAVSLRDQGQCQGTEPTGTRCGDKRWLDIHHVKPVSEGGENIIENLVTLCRGHHKMHHEGYRTPPPGRGASSLLSCGLELRDLKCSVPLE